MHGEELTVGQMYAQAAAERAGELTVPGIPAQPDPVAPPAPTPGIALEPAPTAPARVADPRPWQTWPRGWFTVHATFPSGEVEHAKLRGHQVEETARAYAALHAGVTVEDLEA